jgi:hypothetical protein
MALAAMAAKSTLLMVDGLGAAAPALELVMHTSYHPFSHGQEPVNVPPATTPETLLVSLFRVGSPFPVLYSRAD